MKKRRLPVERLPDAPGPFELSPEAAHHLRVLRLAPGAALVLFDGGGREAEAELVALEGDAARVRVLALVEREPLGVPLVLLVGLTRGGKLDDVVRGCTEIGVREIGPVVCERSQVHAEPSPRQQERLERIAREAARQCGRPDVPALRVPEALARAAAAAPAAAEKLMFVPGAAHGLGEWLARRGPCDEVWAVVGPEGGLAEPEQAALAALGFHALGLGPTTLRVETAAIAVVAQVCAHLRRAPR